MTVVEALKAGPLPAARVARLTDLPLVEAYEQLVAAEARGEVRVVVEPVCAADRRERKGWELMAEEIAP